MVIMIKHIIFKIVLIIGSTLMKKIYFLVLSLLFISGCSSFGKGIAEAVLENDDKVDTRQCDIRGDKFDGINQYFANGKEVKVLIIHGVGTHQSGYSGRIRDNLCKKIGLHIVSRRPKNITLIDPNDKKTVIGILRVSRAQSKDKQKTILFYELAWSETTIAQKQILKYDMAKENTYKRAAFNNVVKGFMNDTVPDPLIYLTDEHNYILNATKQSTCWMLGKSWEQLKDGDKTLCKVPPYKQIKGLSEDNIIFVTHSLGSRIFIDSILSLAEDVALAEKANPQSRYYIDQLKNQELTVFMLANQLPFLQIGRKVPKVHGQMESYCKVDGKNYKNRIFKRLNIVAFSDPNDILSYTIPQSFADNYLDSRICPYVTNVNLNIIEPVSAFGISAVNPLAAHTNYDNDERVLEIITQGTQDDANEAIASGKCYFYETQD